MIKKLEFRLSNNTDTVDIDQKCVGISAWVVGDSVNILNTDRGLHIQIRHNGDKNTFDAANQLANLVSSASLLLEALEQATEQLETDWELAPLDGHGALLRKLQATIAKAKGR